MITPADRWRTSPILLGALGLVGVTFLVDVALGPAWVLTPLIIAGPLVAATAGPPRHSIYVGIVGTILAFVLGWANDIPLTRRHVVSVVTVVLGTVMAAELSRLRERRETQLVRVRPKVDQASRLVRVMQSGRMGEWRWHAADDRVEYDEEVARLFGGTEANPAGGTPTRWLELLDERDRPGALREVQRALDQRRSFRFDHRCNWPDGSVHWLEVVGEPSLDDDGTLVGAQGLVWNVDERYRQLDERARLLDLEHYARLRAEYVTRVHDVLSRSTDVEEILRRVTQAAVPDIADWCTAVFVVDRAPDAPLIVAAHRDPHMEEWAQEVLAKFPYDPDARFGVARVVRNGVREVIEHLPVVMGSMTDDQRELLDVGDVESVVTVPIIGQLGTLGALQMIRGRQRVGFTAADVELTEELASRCGAALNTAVLFARQRTSSEALETLQRVSGWLARAVTRHDVAAATVTHGADGLRATGGCIYVVGDDEVLAPMTSSWLGEADRDGWLQSLAQRSIDDDRLLVEVSRSGAPRTAFATPLRILDRITGAMVFVFDGRRDFVQEELAMALTLASRCAGAMERASYYERERHSALLLQRRLLPQVPVIPEWLEVGFCYEPAAGGQVGGDWFQLITVDDERVVAVVGDAVGHGLGAAAAMGQLRSSIATAASIDPDPAEVLRTVDRFANAGTETLAATAVATLLDRCGTCRIASAGHPPPVLLHAAGGSDVLEGGRRPLLGYGDGRAGASSCHSLGVGDMMVLYSDGLVERRREVLDVGIARMQAALRSLRHLPAQEVCNQLVDHLGGEGRTDDDIAILLVRYTGAGACADEPPR